MSLNIFCQKYPEDLGLNFSIGYLFDSVGGDETGETGAEGVPDVVTK